MNRDEFMEYARSDEFQEQISYFDRVELMMHSASFSDRLCTLIDEAVNRYEVEEQMK